MHSSGLLEKCPSQGFKKSIVDAGAQNVTKVMHFKNEKRISVDVASRVWLKSKEIRCALHVEMKQVITSKWTFGKKALDFNECIARISVVAWV